jgi:hypothetical protein
MEKMTVMAKLVSIASTPKSQTNAEGKITNFYPCTIEFSNPSGELIQRSARVFEGNLKYGMNVGESYSTAVKFYVDSKGVEQVDLVVSHLQGTQRASRDDFGFSTPVVPTSSNLNFVG